MEPARRSDTDAKEALRKLKEKVPRIENALTLATWDEERLCLRATTRDAFYTKLTTGAGALFSADAEDVCDCFFALSGGDSKQGGPVTVTVIISDTALELNFAEPPTSAALFAAFEKQLGQTRLMEEAALKLYFRLRDGNYVGVTPSTTTISWDMYDFNGKVCYARVAPKTPPSSPDRPSVKPLREPNDSVFAELTAKLKNLKLGTASASPLVHLDMAPRELANEPTLEQLGLYFPLVGLDNAGDSLIEAVEKSWRNFPSAQGAARNACVLVAGGASGTGKTRFGAALPRVLLAAAHRRENLALQLVSALQECVTRQLVLQINVSSPDDVNPASLVNAYFVPPATASNSRFARGAGEPPSAGTVLEACQIIAKQERMWRPHDGPIAIIVHLDEVQRLVDSLQFTEEAAGKRLGALVSKLADALWSDNVGLFPIFYVSGLSKTLVLRTASCDRPIPVNLPLLTAAHYVDILRSLFQLAKTWTPPEPLARALRCIEGPPRLLLLFLWAVQAHGQANDKLFGTKMDLVLLRAFLEEFTWAQNSATLYRCLDALNSGRLVTFTSNIQEGSGQLEMFHNLCALVLLGQPVPPKMLLAPCVPVNEAIMLGFAQAQSEGELCRLHWPRIYIWALAKWCASTLDGLPIPAPSAALTPTPRLHTPDAWRYIEDADIKLLCLRLFALLQRACIEPGNTTHQNVNLGQLLPCVDKVADKAADSSTNAIAALEHAKAAAKAGRAANTHLKKAVSMAKEKAEVADITAADAESLKSLVVEVPSNRVVRAKVSSTALLPTTLPLQETMPFAAINKEKTSYADSVLLLKLARPAPRACCPANIAVSEGSTRQYKTIAPEHHNLLVVLLQSKHHESDPQRNESYQAEYAKCIATPIPFVFVLISSATDVTWSATIKWPYNGNGYFVGKDNLQEFYGDFLYRMRAEAWL